MDPTGYVGSFRFLEVMLGGKNRRGSGLWAETEDLTRIVHDAAFVSKKPLEDSHGQIAHYRSQFPLFDKDDPERRAELSEQVAHVPHLADFHVDIDHDGDLEASRVMALKVVDYYLSLGIAEEAIGIRFSGSKGFDISLPWQLFGVQAQGVMSLAWTTWKLFGRELIHDLDLSGVDEGLWRKNGTIRLENTRHPKSGLFKVRLTPKELRSSIKAIQKLAEQPRAAFYRPEAIEVALAVPNAGLRPRYLALQAQADADIATITALRQRPLDPEIAKELEGGLVACLENIARSSPARGTRNVTTFHAAMMMKRIQKGEEAAQQLVRGWLGDAAYNDVGAEGTINSVYTGPYEGGCRWMRESGYATPSECAACPVGRFRTPRKARVVEAELPVVAADSLLPTIAEQRVRLQEDLAHLNPGKVTVVSIPAGVGKTHATLQRAVSMVREGQRVLFFVKDTRSPTGLAADMIDELREKHDYFGKVQILRGRDADNCEDWTTVQAVTKKGYPVATTVCNTCPARPHCAYYRQYDDAYEAGIYIAPHAMLPIIFNDDWRGFSHEYVGYTDDGKRGGTVGGPLGLIVIDEDALDVMVDRFWLGRYHLESELKQKIRHRKRIDKLTGGEVNAKVPLDPNWLRIIEWLLLTLKIDGPVMPTLASIARADGADVRAVLHAIDPANIIDPDIKRSKGHRPFTSRLYYALMAEVKRLRDGNFTIWRAGEGISVMRLVPIQFPPGIPVLVLDAYANHDLYQRYYRAAGVNRLLEFRDYPVREQANVTYVLGANLLSRDIETGSEKINRVMLGLQALTADGVETYIVAKRAFFASAAWEEWAPRLPNCVADGDAGQLHFWRGRGINAASGKRIAVVQVPNFHPDHVFSEASLLYADEPRLDNQRERVETDIIWADGADAVAMKVDRVMYADERLNLINERYRMDELVQMALRSRSLTTGAEIILFADLPDPRLPATRVVLLDDISREQELGEARRVIYAALEELEALNMQNLIDLGVVTGSGAATPLRSAIKRTAAAELQLVRSHPVAPAVAAAEASLT